MEYLFANWKIAQNRIRQAKALFLFLDYDGTLTPIVDRPDQALCPAEIKSLLKRLRKCPQISIAIISGRSIQDIRKKVGISGIIYVGNHGLEIDNFAGTHKKKLSSARVKELKKIKKILKETLKPIPGILLEDKGPILAIHYRGTPIEYSGQVQKIVTEAVERCRDFWETVTGKQILEIRPSINFNKGEAIRELLEEAALPGLLPVYVGDDLADEGIFQVLHDKGISVSVGADSGPFVADYFLHDPTDVHEFLRRIDTIRMEWTKESRVLES